MKLSKQTYVQDGKASQAIARTKLACAGLGNKAPRCGYWRVKYCPLCRPDNVLLNERHVVMSCRGVRDAREAMGLTTSFNLGKLMGKEEEELFFLFVNGLDKDGTPIEERLYIERGEQLHRIYTEFLSKW